MSNGRKVKVEFTQAEAAMQVRVLNFIFDAIMGPISPQDFKALERARDKLQHQLNAVRGKVSGGAV